ncbi:MAG: hypothetical protein KF772_04780 [Cryobacterium sp.]|nr:hypothetical protein [Cryobacterium sp.]
MPTVVGAAYGAEALAIAVEGLVPIVPKNPVTGEDWQSGEAERAWLEQDGVSKNWVREVMIFEIGTRSGEAYREVIPFVALAEEVFWEETMTTSTDEGGLAGALIEALKKDPVDVSRVPDPGDGFAGDPVNGPFYEPERGRVVLDVGVTRSIGSRLDPGTAKFVVSSESQAQYLIDEGLPDWQVELDPRESPGS